MSDTLDLLEVIGRDASLRHASKEELTKILVHTHASEVLTAAVASGDSSMLFREFAYMHTQGNLTPAHEEDPHEESPLGPSEPEEPALPPKN